MTDLTGSSVSTHGHEDEESYGESYFGRHISWFNTRWSSHRIELVSRLIRPRKNDVILDLGCGVGTFTLSFSKRCSYTIGVDSSSYAVLMAKARLKRMGDSMCADIVRADVQFLPFVSASIDKIVCADLVEHLHPREYLNLLGECWRVLLGTGKLGIYTPNASHLFEFLRRSDFLLRKEKTHVHMKTPEYLQITLKKREFDLTETYLSEGHVPLLNIVEKLFMRLPIVSKFFARRICVLAEKMA